MNTRMVFVLIFFFMSVHGMDRDLEMALQGEPLSETQMLARQLCTRLQLTGPKTQSGVYRAIANLPSKKKKRLVEQVKREHNRSMPEINSDGAIIKTSRSNPTRELIKLLAISLAESTKLQKRQNYIAKQQLQHVKGTVFRGAVASAFLMIVSNLVTYFFSSDIAENK